MTGQIILRFIFVFNFLFTLNCFAKDLEIQEIYSVSIKEYQKQFVTLLKEEFCKDESPFQLCFNLPKGKCQNEVKESLEQCYQKQKLPTKINLILAGEKLSAELGSCSAQEFYQRNKSSFAQAPNCRRRSAWLNTDLNLRKQD